MDMLPQWTCFMLPQKPTYTSMPLIVPQMLQFMAATEAAWICATILQQKPVSLKAEEHGQPGAPLTLQQCSMEISIPQVCHSHSQEQLGPNPAG